MRSVVVVLPASMCAMMPMLRTLVRSVSTSCATARFPLFRLLVRCSVAPGGQLTPMSPTTRLTTAGGQSPAVVREGPVRLGHLVGVLTPLDCGTQAVAGVQDLVRQTLDHGFLPARLREADQPAQCQRGRPLGTHLDGHLVGRATDTAAANLECGLDVVESALQSDDRIGAGLVAGLFERTIHNAFRQRF